jgi:alpha/beta superfamily hydrolase
MTENFRFFEITGDNDEIIRGSLHLSQPSDAPWVIFCHGFTGQRMGPAYLFVKLSKILAASGISSLRFDFRGSGESDGIFADMTTFTMQSDLNHVINMLDTLHMPSGKILFGHSFGAMICALSSHQTNADGMIFLAPVADPEKLIQQCNDTILKGANSEGKFEYGPHEMNISFIDGLKNIDPVKTLIEHYKNPLLLIQGDNDKSISVRESGRYVHAARKVGISTDYQIINGADHNFSRVSDVKQVCNTVTNWIKEQFR